MPALQVQARVLRRRASVLLGVRARSAAESAGGAGEPAPPRCCRWGWRPGRSTDPAGAANRCGPGPGACGCERRGDTWHPQSLDTEYFDIKRLAAIPLDVKLFDV